MCENTVSAERGGLTEGEENVCEKEELYREKQVNVKDRVEKNDSVGAWCETEIQQICASARL